MKYVKIDKILRKRRYNFGKKKEFNVYQINRWHELASWYQKRLYDNSLKVSVWKIDKKFKNLPYKRDVANRFTTSGKNDAILNFASMYAQWCHVLFLQRYNEA